MQTRPMPLSSPDFLHALSLPLTPSHSYEYVTQVGSKDMYDGLSSD